MCQLASCTNKASIDQPKHIIIKLTRNTAAFCLVPSSVRVERLFIYWNSNTFILKI